MESESSAEKLNFFVLGAAGVLLMGGALALALFENAAHHWSWWGIALFAVFALGVGCVGVALRHPKLYHAAFSVVFGCSAFLNTAFLIEFGWAYSIETIGSAVVSAGMAIGAAICLARDFKTHRRENLGSV